MVRARARGSTLFHTAGNFMDRIVFIGRQTYHFQIMAGSFLLFLRRDPGQHQRKSDIFDHIQPGKKTVFLEHDGYGQRRVL